MGVPKKRNQLTFKILIVVLTLLVCVVVYYFFFQLRARQQNNYRDYAIENTPLCYPFSSNRQILNLGWVHKMHDGLSNTSYLLYDTIKKSGTLRIGIFGCSFSEAFDVTGEYDIATQLQRKYQNEGYKNVEVISFGTGGYGLGQMMMLYEYIGKKYDLDIVVINSFFMYHFPRDLSFRLYNNYGPLHARYITEGDSVHLIEYKDTSLVEAYKHYYSLFPDRDFINYDYKPVGFLFPLGMKFNPFYYRKEKGSMIDLINETRELYSGIFKKFANESKRLVVICNDEHTYSLRENFATDTSISFYKSNYYNVRSKATSIYTSTSWHNSPVGNKFYADELFNFLEKKMELLTYLKFKKSDSPATIFTASFDSIAFKIGAATIHQLYYPSPGDISDEDWNRAPDYAESVNLNSKNVSNLLLLSESLSDLSFLNLSQQLQQGDTVFFSFNNRNTSEIFPVGTVESVSANIFSVSFFRHEFLRKNYFLRFKDKYNNWLDDFRLLFCNSSDDPNVSFHIGKNVMDVKLKNTSARLVAENDAFNLEFDNVKYFLSENFPDKTLLSTSVFTPVANDKIMRCRMNTDAYVNPDSISGTQQNFNLVIYKDGQANEFPFLKIVSDTLK